MGMGTVVNQALGNVAKAKITIIDRRSVSTKETQKKVTVEEPVTTYKVANIEGAVSATDSTANLNFGATWVGTTTAAKTEIQTQTQVTGGTASGKIFYVQFNPGSLTVSGYGGGKVTKTNFGDAGKSLQFEPADVRITMNVRLIFDKVDPQDAFMFDKLNTSLTAVGTGVAKAVLTSKGKKEVSVQKQVEGFIGAIRSPSTREITFSWGPMSYFGVLNRVSSQYVMFDVLGKPVRAYVDLSLVCADSGIKVGDMGSWQAAYDKAFKESTSYVTSSQKKSNLLNFSI